MIIATTKTLRPRDPDDHYPTPPGLIHAVLTPFVQAFERPCILDIGAGDGVWGRTARAIWPNATITGAELRPVAPAPEYDVWLRGDFRQHAPSLFDLVIGNPPYRLAEAAVRDGLSRIYGGGAVVMLLRLAFLEGQARGRGLWRDHRPARVRVLTRRPSFTGNGKTDATAYAVFEWAASPARQTQLDWLDWKES